MGISLERVLLVASDGANTGHSPPVSEKRTAALGDPLPSVYGWSVVSNPANISPSGKK